MGFNKLKVCFILGTLSNLKKSLAVILFVKLVIFPSKIQFLEVSNFQGVNILDLTKPNILATSSELIVINKFGLLEYLAYSSEFVALVNCVFIYDLFVSLSIKISSNLPLLNKFEALYEALQVLLVSS